MSKPAQRRLRGVLTGSLLAAFLSVPVARAAPPSDAPADGQEDQPADTSVPEGPQPAPDGASGEDPQPDPEPEPEDEGPDPRVGRLFDMKPGNRLDAYGPRPPGVPKLTREQLVRYALENPAIEMAQADIEIMESYLLQARFAWVPIIKTQAILAPGANIKCDQVELVVDPNTVSSGSGVNENGNLEFQYCRSGAREDLDLYTIRGYLEQLGDAGIAFELRADILFPVTTFGKIWNARKAAEIGVAISKLKKQATRQETILKVYEAHAALLLARESIKILEEAWDVIEDERKKAVKDLGGTGFEIDVDAMNPDRDPDDLVEIEVGEIEIAILMREARKIESLSLAALWAIAGDAAPPGFDVSETALASDPVDGGLQELGHYQELAMKNRPEAKMASAAVELRQRQEKLARANFLPDLGVNVTAKWGIANRAQNQVPALYYSRRLNPSSLIIAAVLNWNMDFHNDAFGLKRARAQRRKSESQRELAQRLLGLEVEQAYRDLTDAEDDAEFMELARDKSWALVVSQQQKQSIGGGEFKDLRRHLENWAQFEFKHFEAIYARNAALARLSRAVGTPLTSHLGAKSGPAGPQR